MSEQFGRQFRAWRKNAQLTQRELADRLGINFTYVSKIEHGKNPVAPSEALLRRAATCLGVDPLVMLRLSDRTICISIAAYERLCFAEEVVGQLRGIYPRLVASAEWHAKQAGKFVEL